MARIEIEFKRVLRRVRDAGTGEISGVEFTLTNLADGSSVVRLASVRQAHDKACISDVWRDMEVDFVTRCVTTAHLRNHYILDYEEASDA